MTTRSFKQTPELSQALDTIAKMDRRSFLTFSTAVVAAVATGTLPSVAHATVELSSINSLETAVFAKLAAAVFPTEGSILMPYNEEVILKTLDGALLATMPPHILAGLKGGIGYFNEGPKEQFGKSFVDLSTQDAAKFCDLWSDSNEIPQRALQVGLKKLIQLSYWANPESWPATGYDGPVSRKNKFQSLGNSPLPVED